MQKTASTFVVVVVTVERALIIVRACARALTQITVKRTRWWQLTCMH